MPTSIRFPLVRVGLTRAEMAWTYHGHQIPKSPVESPRPNLVARCGGMRMCRACMQDAANWSDSNTTNTNILERHDEGTVKKVYHALLQTGLTNNQALDAINEMQNVGILFRERAK